MIRGVSTRSARAQDQLEPQDGLYTLVERDDDSSKLRIVGSFASVAMGDAALVEAVAAPSTALVTLTITEKGYETQEGDPERKTPARPVASMIALGLARRRESGARPPVIAPLDNVVNNGAVLRARVIEMAERGDSTLGKWIANEVLFPNSVVDRMVPATTEKDFEEIASAIGLVDRAGVTCEPYSSWILTNVPDIPPLGDVGVRLVGDTLPWEQRKLWLLNGPHSALAYCGLLFGHTTIASAVEDPVVSSFVGGLIDDILVGATIDSSLSPEAFARDAMRRFRNRALGHTCVQVAADGSSKLPQRLLPIVARRRARSLGTARFATVIAIWLAALTGMEVAGRILPSIEDPLSAELRKLAPSRNLGRITRVALRDAVEDAFAEEITIKLARVLSDGKGVLEGQP